MNQDDDSPVSTDDPRVLAALDEYMAALEAGAPPNRTEFLARHGELAASLAPCLDGMDILHEASVDRDTVAGAVPPGAAWASGTVLGDFQIVREIGRGGMGVVYEARQISLDRRVALKVLALGAVLDDRRLRRFQNEALTHACLNHPHIVPIYAVGCENGAHFFAMQFIEGQSLAEVINELHQSCKPEVCVQSGVTTVSSVAGHEDPAAAALAGGESTTAVLDSRPSPPSLPRPVGPTTVSLATRRRNDRTDYLRRVATLGITAAEALEHAHQAGIVHRDVKPGNLLLDANDKLWITDFGLATMAADSGLTQSGEVLGTLRYMSPEQALAKQGLIDHRTDIYSLGATLYELLTLAAVYEGRDRFELIQRMTFQDPKPLRRLDPAIPSELELIVLKALSQSPQDRYASAEAMAADLRRFLNHEPILARRPSLTDRTRKWARRHPSFVIAAALLMILGMVALSVSAALIAREKDKTQKAYDAEKLRAQEAEQRFQLARRSADEMVRVAEEELSNDPQQMNARRRLLDTALEYYQEFIRLRADDPEAQVELASTRLHIQRILDDLAIIRGGERHLLLSEPLVQEDLQLSPAQRAALEPVFAKISPPGPIPDVARGTDERSQQQLNEMKANENQIGAILTKSQLARLQQVLLQIHGAHALLEPEIVAALNLTPQQRERLRTLRRRGPPGGPLRQGPPGGPGLELEGGGGPRPGPLGDRGDGPGRFGPGRPGRPPPRPGFPGEHAPARMLLRRLGDPGFQQELQDALHILTPLQQARWEELRGPPLRWQPAAGE